MNPASSFLLLSTLAAPAFARANSEPRTPRPIPFQSADKLPGENVVATHAEPADPTDAPTLGEPPRKLPGTEVPRAPISARAFDRVHYTTQRDGSIWASGNTYKAGFGASGATYVPFLGSQAPRNFPLEMSLVSATVDGVEIPLERAGAPVRDGDRITIDRGPIDEVYELALDSLEQTFVVAERPGSGDLRFVVRLDTEMTRAESGGGFTYSNEHGSVHYSRAFVRESDGTRVPVTTRATNEGVEIVVGRDYLAQASFPLVVDPVITTYTVSATAQDTWDSDVAYDLTTDRYLTVYEFNFSQSDGEIYAELREAGFNLSYFGILDNTPENWRSPQCANLNSANQFLMVAQASNVLGAPNWNIWGMTIDATSFVAGWKTLISTTDQTGPKYLPDVGGDSHEGPGAAYYCVTWRRDFTATDWDIHARLVTAQSSLVGSQTLFVDNSGSSRDSWPSISKSNGTRGVGAAWTIAWHREVTTTNYNVHAAQVSWDGLLVSGPTQHTTSTGFEYYPRASSPLEDGRSLVIYGILSGNQNDIDYMLLSGGVAVGFGSVTEQDAAPTLARNHIEYSIDSDGSHFVVAYAEQFLTSTFDYDIYISSFAPFSNSIYVAEAHQLLDNTAQQSLRTDLVAQRSGGAVGSRRFYVSWDSTGNGGHDVFSATYDRPLGGAVNTFCFGNGTTATPCPCGDNTGFESGCPNSYALSGAFLSSSGAPQPGSGDDLVMQVHNVPPNVTCTLFQGTLGNNGVAFGDGVRCVAGAQIRIRTKNADGTGSAIWPSGAEADLSVTGAIPVAGALRYYQVSYRNSASYCTPATFNISSGLRVVWLP